MTWENIREDSFFKNLTPRFYRLDAYWKIDRLSKLTTRTSNVAAYCIWAVIFAGGSACLFTSGNFGGITGGKICAIAALFSLSDGADEFLDRRLIEKDKQDNYKKLKTLYAQMKEGVRAHEQSLITPKDKSIA